MGQSFSHLSIFLHHFILAKLATSSINQVQKSFSQHVHHFSDGQLNKKNKMAAIIVVAWGGSV